MSEVEKTVAGTINIDAIDQLKEFDTRTLKCLVIDANCHNKQIVKTFKGRSKKLERGDRDLCQLCRYSLFF